MANKQLKILILTSTYPRWAHDSTPGFVAEFARTIAKQAAAVYVLAPHFKQARRHETVDGVQITRYRYFIPASAEDIAYNGGGVTKIKKTPLYAFKLLCFMAALFVHTLFMSLTKRVTVINAHWLIPQGFAAVVVKLITGKRVVVTVHGSDVLALNGKYMRMVKRFTLRHADEVCVNSSVTLAACEALYKRPYHLIPMGIEMSRYQNLQPSPELRNKYQLDDFTILFVGRLTKEKGVIYLLEALSLLKRTGTSFRSLIVGSGPLERELRTYVDEHQLNQNVTMVGWVDSSELPTYYATADIFVGPSLHEAQGLVFLEALASGLPVITTDQGGMKDFIINGENGFMVPPESPQALYEKLLLVHDNPALLQSLKDKAAPSVTNTYSWDAVTSEYVKVLEVPAA